MNCQHAAYSALYVHHLKQLHSFGLVPNYVLSINGAKYGISIRFVASFEHRSIYRLRLLCDLLLLSAF